MKLSNSNMVLVIDGTGNILLVIALLGGLSCFEGRMDEMEINSIPEG